MKKSLLLLIIIFTSLILFSIQNVSSLINNGNEEFKNIHGKEYVIRYYPTSYECVGFESYGHLIKKPKTGFQSGSYSQIRHDKFIISGSINIKAGFEGLFYNFSGSLTIGLTYEFGRQDSFSQNWTYNYNDYGDYAIFGIKRFVVKYYYRIYELVPVYNQINKGEKVFSHYNEKFEESGEFWLHSQTGLMGLFAFKESEFELALYYLNRGICPSFLKDARDGSDDKYSNSNNKIIII